MTELPRHLLQPSLADGAQAAPPLSPAASFLVSFFGGGVSAALVGAFNAQRLRRPRLDLILAAVAVLGTFALMLVPLSDVLPEIDARIAPRISQGLGVLIWGLFAWLQRAERRAQALSALELRRAWVPIVGILVIGSLAPAFVAALRGFFGGLFG